MCRYSTRLGSVVFTRITQDVPSVETAYHRLDNAFNDGWVDSSGVYFSTLQDYVEKKSDLFTTPLLHKEVILVRTVRYDSRPGQGKVLNEGTTDGYPVIQPVHGERAVTNETLPSLASKLFALNEKYSNLSVQSAGWREEIKTLKAGNSVSKEEVNNLLNDTNVAPAYANTIRELQNSLDKANERCQELNERNRHLERTLLSGKPTTNTTENELDESSERTGLLNAVSPVKLNQTADFSLTTPQKPMAMEAMFSPDRHNNQINGTLNFSFDMNEIQLSATHPLNQKLSDYKSRLQLKEDKIKQLQKELARHQKKEAANHEVYMKKINQMNEFINHLAALPPLPQ